MADGRPAWESFIELLQDVRTATGQSLRAFARQTGFSYSTIHRALTPTWDSFPNWSVTRAILVAGRVNLATLETGGGHFGDLSVDVERHWRTRYRTAYESWEEDRQQARLRAHKTDLGALEESNERARNITNSSRHQYLPDVANTATIQHYSLELRRLKYVVGNPTFASIARRMIVPETTVTDLCNGRRRRLDFAVVDRFVEICLAEARIADPEFRQVWMSLLSTLSFAATTNR